MDALIKRKPKVTVTEFHNLIKDKLFRGSLPSWQREPLDQLIAEGQRRQRSLEEVAYVLATAYHETARFKHMEEIGEGGDRDYAQPILLIRGKHVKLHGRGFVQLTWLRNYALMSVFLTLELQREVDLVNNPDLAKEPGIAAAIIWEGMIRGFFTGHQLSDHINGEKVDYVGARKIVNGTDRDDLIAGYAHDFEDALRLFSDEQTPENSLCGLNRSDCPVHQKAAT